MLLISNSRYEELLSGNKYLALLMHAIHFVVDDDINTGSRDLSVTILSHSCKKMLSELSHEDRYSYQQLIGKDTEYFSDSVYALLNFHCAS